MHERLGRYEAALADYNRAIVHDPCAAISLNARFAQPTPTQLNHIPQMNLHNSGLLMAEHCPSLPVDLPERKVACEM